MKQLALMLLLLFICAPGTLRAQSGRRQNDKGSNSTSGRTQPVSDPAASNPSDEEGMVNQGTGEGEIIEGDVLRVNTALVTVPVSVMDRNGKYIPDLSREDFHIFDEGIEQRVAYFATVDQPFTVALVIDTSGSTDFRLEDIQQAAIAFVNQLKPEDRVMIISFDDQINVLTRPISDRDELIKAIRRTRTGGGTRLYDAVDQVIKKHLKPINGRKAMVLFTDGVDTTSRQASYDSTLRAAEELDALIYPVSYETKNNGRWGGGTPQQIPLPGGRGGVILGIPFPRAPCRAAVAAARIPLITREPECISLNLPEGQAGDFITAVLCWGFLRLSHKSRKNCVASTASVITRNMAGRRDSDGRLRSASISLTWWWSRATVTSTPRRMTTLRRQISSSSQGLTTKPIVSDKPGSDHVN